MHAIEKEGEKVMGDQRRGLKEQWYIDMIKNNAIFT